MWTGATHYRWTIEAFHNLGSLLNGHRAIQADIQVPEGESKDQYSRRKQEPWSQATEGTRILSWEGGMAEGPVAILLGDGARTVIQRKETSSGKSFMY